MGLSEWLAEYGGQLNLWLSDGSTGLVKYLPGSWFTGSQAPRWLIYSTVAVTTAVTAAAAFVQCKPGTVLDWMIRVAIRQAGIEVKYAEGEKYVYRYGERGSRSSGDPSLVLVHGFGVSMDGWLDVVKGLPLDIHVVLVELPGQSNYTTIPETSEDGSLYAMTDLMAEFVTLVGLDKKPFHMAGISFGGSLTGLFAAKYSQYLSRATIMTPGVKTPILTETYQETLRGESNLLFTEDTASMKKAFKDMMYYPNKAPNANWIYRGIMKEMEPRKKFLLDFLNQGMDEIHNGWESKMSLQFSKIDVPVQIIWGENDKSLHVSGAAMLESLISTCQGVHILKECGHLINIDQAEKLTHLIVKFHRKTFE